MNAPSMDDGTIPSISSLLTLIAVRVVNESRAKQLDDALET